MPKDALFANVGDNVTLVFHSEVAEMLKLPFVMPHVSHVLLLGDVEDDIPESQWDAILHYFDHIFLHGQRVQRFGGSYGKVIHIPSIRNVEATVTRYLVMIPGEIIVTVHTQLEKLILGA